MKMGKNPVDNIVAAIFYGILIVIVILSWTSTGHCKETDVLRASPRLAIVGRPVLLTLHTEKCYDIRWSWSDGTESFQSADCDEDEPMNESKRVAFGSPGDYTIYVYLERAERVIKKLSVDIHVSD